MPYLALVFVLCFGSALALRLNPLPDYVTMCKMSLNERFQFILMTFLIHGGIAFLLTFHFQGGIVFGMLATLLTCSFCFNHETLRDINAESMTSYSLYRTKAYTWIIMAANVSNAFILLLPIQIIPWPAPHLWWWVG